jgi:hypothetical protein
MSDLHLIHRHSRKCRKPSTQTRTKACNCIFWVDGVLNGERIRQSLGTRDQVVAARRLQNLVISRNDDKQRESKKVADAITAFLATKQDLA